MKKNNLKASLGRIRPREELINSTISMVAEQKKRQERRFVLPSYSFGLRLAGAVCAFVLVFCIGFLAARQNINQPDVKTLGQLEVTEASTAEIARFALDNEYENGYILINGNIDSMTFAELTASEIENGAVKKSRVQITAIGLVEKSDDLSVDLNKTSETFVADILFYDNDALEAFIDQSTGNMILRLTPDENGNWSIVEFAPFKK